MISENIHKLKMQIAEICQINGKKPEEITLVAVSKTKPISSIIEAISFGQIDFGENYIQEAVEKYEELTKINARAQLHFIGALQTNKVKYLTKFCYLFHGLDRQSLAEALDKRLKFESKKMDCLIQINTSGEASKSGVEPDKSIDFVKVISEKYSNIKVKGLMTIAENSEDRAEIRKNFKQLKQIFEEIKILNLPNIEMKALSMGMSSDFDIAIEEGSTMIRVGSAIFGGRK